MPGREGKIFTPQSNLSVTVQGLLTQIQSSLLARATAFRDSHIFDPKTYDELKEVLQNGWAFSWWCEMKECEAKVKEDTKASTRVIPIEQPGGTGKCIACGEKADKKVYFARGY